MSWIRPTEICSGTGQIHQNSKNRYCPCRCEFLKGSKELYKPHHLTNWSTSKEARLVSALGRTKGKKEGRYGSVYWAPVGLGKPVTKEARVTKCCHFTSTDGGSLGSESAVPTGSAS